MTKNNVLKFIFVAMCVLTVAVTINSCSQMNNSVKIDLDTIELVQFEDIADDAQVAVIKTTLGDMKAVLYPEYAPNTVQNFINLAQSGYYDGTYIFRIQDEAYFAGGSPNTDGSLDDDYDEESEKIANEFHQNLWPFKGAICSLSEFKNCSGSRFVVVDSIEFTDEIKEEMLSSSENTLLSDAFIEHGGVPNYSQQMTVFAQIYEGLDIVDVISSQDSDPDNEYQPYEEIIINSIEISTYGEEKEKDNTAETSDIVE
jgi:peptidyl-prolyl cis-trans isomerase B (cyclophilin B)